MREWARAGILAKLETRASERSLKNWQSHTHDVFTPQARLRQYVCIMLLDRLKKQHDELQRACHQYGARRIRVFGSVARGEETADSDIDILVDLPRGYNLITQRLPLTRRLAEITGRNLDLIPEHELNPHLRESVLAEAVEL